MKKNEEVRKIFADRVKNSHVEAPIQHVGDVSSQQTEQRAETNKPRTKSNEVQLNVHVDADLIKRLKLKGINEDKNIKEMISEALLMYLL